MACVKCKKDLPDGAIWCCWCGKKQITQPRKRMRKGNGAGSVAKLSGSRRKPWAAYAPAFWNGEKYEQIYLGTFETEALAWEAIRKVAPRALKETYSYTVQDVYEVWKEAHFKTISSKGAVGYEGAWKYVSVLAKRKMRDIRPEDLQRIINQIADDGKSRSLCEKVKQLESQLCKWAIDNDIITRNYAERLKLPAAKKKEHKVFSQEEIEKVETMVQDKRLGELAKITLVMIYTGLRIGELLELEQRNINMDKRYMVGGKKTVAGTNRVIPIHEKVLPYIAGWMEKEGEYLISTSTGKARDVDSTRRSFNSLMEKLGIADVTPHSCRRTYATRLAQANVRPEVISRLMGHAAYDTSELYIVTGLDELQAANKMVG